MFGLGDAHARSADYSRFFSSSTMFQHQGPPSHCRGHVSLEEGIAIARVGATAAAIALGRSVRVDVKPLRCVCERLWVALGASLAELLRLPDADLEAEEDLSEAVDAMCDIGIELLEVMKSHITRVRYSLPLPFSSSPSLPPPPPFLPLPHRPTAARAQLSWRVISRDAGAPRPIGHGCIAGLALRAALAANHRTGLMDACPMQEH